MKWLYVTLFENLTFTNGAFVTWICVESFFYMFLFKFSRTCVGYLHEIYSWCINVNMTLFLKIQLQLYCLINIGLYWYSRYEARKEEVARIGVRSAQKSKVMLPLADKKSMYPCPCKRSFWAWIGLFSHLRKQCRTDRWHYGLGEIMDKQH